MTATRVLVGYHGDPALKERVLAKVAAHRAELIQAIAVAVAWVEAIDRRPT